MSGLSLTLLFGAAVVGLLTLGIVGGAVLLARRRRRDNRVVPDRPTNAPLAWLGAHTPLARLHRRLRAAVQAARAVPDPDGALISARIEIERAALEVDDHLVALHGLAERERAARMAQATSAVASVEEAAARLADAVSTSRSTALPAVEEALERAALVAEARRELEADDPAAILGEVPHVQDAQGDEDAEDDQDEPRPRPSTG